MCGGPEDAKVVCNFTQHGLLLCIICELIHLSCLSLAFPDLQLLAMLLHQVILGLTRTYIHTVYLVASLPKHHMHTPCTNGSG